jgi:phosphoribosylformimino-5-aminoimidazole carboxamide ribotide isomerase
MHIWPAIDLRGGKCVRLQQGDYARETVFGEDPVQMAARWRDAGADRLHLVDLDGARDGEGLNQSAVAAIVQASGLPCQLGGGIREESTIARWLEQGSSGSSWEPERSRTPNGFGPWSANFLAALCWDRCQRWPESPRTAGMR